MLPRPKLHAAAALPLLAALACAQEIELPLAAPLADAGDDQLRRLRPGGLLVGLDGRASCDPEGEAIARYLWTLVSYPAGGHTALDDADTLHPSFVASAVGVYTVQLRVRTAERTSEPDEVLIEIRDDLEVDLPPVAPAHDRCGEPLR